MPRSLSSEAGHVARPSGTPSPWERAEAIARRLGGCEVRRVPSVVSVDHVGTGTTIACLVAKPAVERIDIRTARQGVAQIRPDGVRYRCRPSRGGPSPRPASRISVSSSLVDGYGEPQILPSPITSIWPVGADAGQKQPSVRSLHGLGFREAEDHPDRPVTRTLLRYLPRGLHQALPALRLTREPGTGGRNGNQDQGERTDPRS